MKKLFQLFLIGSSLVCFVFCLSQETGCGCPGIPQNGKMNVSYNGTVSRFNYAEISLNESIRNYHWPLGTRVRYECEMFQKFQLNGSKERNCSDNGTWTGRLPFCDENVAFGKEVLIYDVKEREAEPTSLLTDGKTVGKASGILLADNKQLILRFNSSLNVRSVIVHGDDEEKWEENIGNLIVLRNGQINDPCTLLKISNKSIQWSCPDDGYLTHDLGFFHYSKGKFLITEMQVFARSNATCGYPEIPVHGRVSLSLNPSHTAFYNCFPGFELIGSANRNCTDGIWSGQEPICKFAPSTTILFPMLITDVAAKRQSKEHPTHSAKKSQVTSKLRNIDKIDSKVYEIEGHTIEISTTIMKPTSEPFAAQHTVTIVVLATALGIAVSLLIALFLCKKRRKRRKPQLETEELFMSSYVVPDQKFQTAENIYV